MELFDRISEDIKSAMKAKDRVALDTLRNVKKLFLEAKTAPGANDTLSDADALKLIQKLVKQGRDAADIYRQQGRADLAEAELAQVRVMETYLPRPLTPEELDEQLQRIISEVGAAGPSDMGRVMSAATAALAGRADGRTISTRVRQLLQAM
ncbi:MAG: GatB/YqeY domain-containing protein [Mediterranea sp.]|nr:GatB/YqeY domain-containing protein [Mediterranea sp.]